ncbi:MAG: hypothetical protein R3C56_09175 [Pirellulaceae bacterium]
MYLKQAIELDVELMIEQPIIAGSQRLNKTEAKGCGTEQKIRAKGKVQVITSVSDVANS